MGWFTSDESETEDTSNSDDGSAENGVTATLSVGAKWIWKKAIVGVLTYAANTTVQLYKSGKAFFKAVPTLVTNPEARKIGRGMAYVLVRDVLPLVALNAVNNLAQGYFHEDQEEVTGFGAYSVFLTGLTLVNYTVVAITWRQGAQASARMLLLDGLGPPAFNSNKTIRPPSLCTEFKCNVKREVKGWGREPLILLGNDLLTAGIRYVPYVGPPVARVLSVYFIGRYITRLTTPERCERHKAMMQESVLALGLGYEGTTMLMDAFLEATIGMPPFLYYRVMRHLLLLLHVNVAAHMKLPLVLPKDATVFMDPLNLYERISRFIADVIFAGLKDRIPKDFKLEEGAKPLIPLSTVLKYTTKVLRSDLEGEQPLTPPGLFKRSANTIIDWALPNIFHDATSAVNDKIVADHWPVLREGAISTVEIIGSVGKVNVVPTTTAIKEIVKHAFSKSKGETIAQTAVLTATWTPKFTAKVLHYKWGIPKSVTLVTLKLSKKEDFWNLSDALKAWFERHDVAFEVKLIEKAQVPLLGEKKVEPLPKQLEFSPIIPAQELISERGSLKTSAVSAEQLISEREPLKTSAISAEEIMSERDPLKTSVISSKKVISERQASLKTQTPIISAEELISRRKPAHIMHATNPESLFTIRKRSAPPVQSSTVVLLTDEEGLNNSY